MLLVSIKDLIRPACRPEVKTLSASLAQHLNGARELLPHDGGPRPANQSPKACMLAEARIWCLPACQRLVARWGIWPPPVRSKADLASGTLAVEYKVVVGALLSKDYYRSNGSRGRQTVVVTLCYFALACSCCAQRCAWSFRLSP